MNIFKEIKGYLTALQAAEQYGIKINRNKMACCPFHDDHHPSMKIDQNYYCFACGAKILLPDCLGYLSSRRHRS